ncbi:MAG TPA: hypothetical protein DCK76_04880 [Desulfotomaculum sp.]|nr:MAG: Uncharacterized protein XD84_0884 [Desulfotomaculum sp. 46_80]HAG10716.1 hypothetical protein [Desulfotomaculum sp.]HBY04939.1 hypothetical protein [Desulfotomaculum sp.]
MFNISGNVVVKEDGSKFAVVPVKYQIVKNKIEAEKVQEKSSLEYPGMPIILMAMGIDGIPAYYGQEDIIDYLNNNPTRLPWKLFKVK